MGTLCRLGTALAVVSSPSFTVCGGGRLISLASPTCATTFYTPARRGRAQHDRLGTLRVARRAFTTESNRPTSFAFAFDIDGVLLHSSKPIPGAGATLRFLHKEKIPFILLTNGGGKLEKERAAELCTLLGLDDIKDEVANSNLSQGVISERNLVQSHTPLQRLNNDKDGYANKTILVTGANAVKCREIAESYGFKSVITPADILQACPGIWPFDPLLKELYASTARPLPKQVFTPSAHLRPYDSLKIDAIMVFNDPRDWALDTQLIVDILRSRNGYLGTCEHRRPLKLQENYRDPEIWFSNDDLWWSTGFHLPRLGQGAFQAAIEGVWQRIGGERKMRKHVLGKPHARMYKFAQSMLERHRLHVLMPGGSESELRRLGPLRSVYAIGDNPASDVRGVNYIKGNNPVKWTSILVKTGVWDPRDPPLEGVFTPDFATSDVTAAVAWALQCERWRGADLPGFLQKESDQSKADEDLDMSWFQTHKAPLAKKGSPRVPKVLMPRPPQVTMRKSGSVQK